MSNESVAVDIRSLPDEQLVALDNQKKSAIEALTENFTVLRGALSKYEQSLESLKELQEAKQGEQMLVPLTTSLYIPGKLSDIKKVMVDIGTGYYAEKSVEDADAFLKGKCAYLQKNLKKLQEEVISMKRQRAQVQGLIQQRVRQKQAQSADQKAIE